MAKPQPGHRVFIATYTPLCSTVQGRNAVAQFGLPPFIDGSIRREPDLQHERPSISCLCRKGKFAPRLRPGDHVLYLTHKRRYGGMKDRHWRLTALLWVQQTFASHEAAAETYRAWGYSLPSNCMVDANEPVPLEQSHHKTTIRGCSRVLERWDEAYRERCADWPIFVACVPIFRDLTATAPVVTEADLIHAFGRVPGTQNPGAFFIPALRRLLARLELAVAVED